MRKPLSARTLLSIAALLVLGALLVKNVAAGPANDARPKDAAKSQRQARVEGEMDSREPLAAPALVAGNGVVEPVERETRLGAAVPGRIARVLAREGSEVSAGELLVELDDEQEQAALAAAEGDLAVAQATLSRVAKGQRAEDIDALVGEAEAAKARARLSAEIATRTDALTRSGASPTSVRDDARRQAEADDGAARAADARRLAAVHGARHEDVVIASAQVRAALARRDQARATLDRLHVRAPIEGTVLQIKARAGEYYNPSGGEPLLVLGDVRILKVRMDVDERDIAKIRLARPAYVTLSAYPDRRFGGKVVEIARRMGRKNVRTDDPVERLDTKILEVVIALDDASVLVPGIRVTAYVHTS